MTADDISSCLTDVQNQTQHLLAQLNIDAALAAPLLQAVARLEQAITTVHQPTHDPPPQADMLFQYQQALTHAPIAICMLHGPELRYSFSNEPYHQIIGRSDILNKSIRKVVEFSTNAIYQILDHVYQTGQAFTKREMLISYMRHGESAPKEAYFDINYVPLRTVSGSVSGIVAYILDVSDRQALDRERAHVLELTREAHFAADSERQRLLRVLHESPSAICIIEGPEHILSFTNPAFDQLVGQRQFSRISARTIFPEIEFQGFFELLDQVYATGIPYIGKEMSVLFDRDGTGSLTQTFLNFIFAPLYDSSNKVTGIFVQAIDITELVLARQEARAAVTVRDQFLSIAAHELRTPLTSLLGYTQVIQRRLRSQESLDPRVLKALQTMEFQSKRLSRLIDMLLDVARMNTGHLLVSKAPLEFNQVVQQAIDEISITSKSRTIHLQLAATECYIEGDSLRLEQVIINLVQNALKYSEQDTPVEVTVVQNQTTVSLIVRDYGIGVPDKYMPYIFERFYRVNEHSINSISGMGIGLSVVKEIVTLHGGTVHVESQAGHGSIFTVQLPKLESDPSP